jgi:hypothetical protein
VVVSDVPPADHPVEESDLAALTDELTRLAREDDEASEEALPADLDDLLGGDVDAATDDPAHPGLDELVQLASEQSLAEREPTLQELSDALGISVGEPADEPPAPAPPLFADHPAAAPTETAAPTEAEATADAEARTDGEPPVEPGTDEPMPWVGHTDQLDAPEPPQPAPPPRDTTRDPLPQGDVPVAAHRAHDGSTVAITGTDGEQLVVRRVPAGDGAATAAAASAAAEPGAPQPPDEAHRAAQEPDGDGPATRVHAERIDSRPGPIQLTPSEAVALASEGPRALRRVRREP